MKLLSYIELEILLNICMTFRACAIYLDYLYIPRAWLRSDTVPGAGNRSQNRFAKPVRSARS